MPRSAEDILEDVRKLTKLMNMLKFMGDGYTINQRIEHHEQMTELLKEFRDVDGDVALLPA